MYYHNRIPQADEEEQDEEQNEEEMEAAEDRLVEVMTESGAPRAEAEKAVKGKVRQAQ